MTIEITPEPSQPEPDITTQTVLVMPPSPEPEEEKNEIGDQIGLALKVGSLEGSIDAIRATLDGLMARMLAMETVPAASAGVTEIEMPEIPETEEPEEKPKHKGFHLW